MGQDLSKTTERTVARGSGNQAFGECAIRNGLLTPDAIAAALAELNDEQSLGEFLVAHGSITARDREALEHLVHDSSDRDGPWFSLPGSASTVALQSHDTDRAPRDGTIPSEIGAQFGDYEIIDVLGRGGMGVVYKARQRNLNRTVALKMIRAGEFSDSNQVRRFFAEAEAAASLDHPGIVPVFESGEVHGRHFYSMAFVEGHPLHRELQDGPMDPRRAAEVIKQVADALHYAHERGIVHRDIKPGNILLATNGTPRIADFGLAKQLTSDNDMTIEGHIIGTPSYMAPEQASGQSHTAGAAADIYAVGASLYYLVTGRPPLQAASKLETLRQVVEMDPAPPRRLNPAIARDLETICLKCLRKEPKARYATAADLSDDLQNWLNRRPINARPTSVLEKSWLWCKRRPAVAGSIALLVIAALLVAGLMTYQQRTNAERIARAKVENDRNTSASLVESTLHAPPLGLPYAIESLKPYASYVTPMLRQQLAGKELLEGQRLNAIVALAQLGEVRQEALIDSIRDCSADQSGNLIAALRPSPEAVSAIRNRAQGVVADQPEQREYLARLAITALYLGDSSLALLMTQSDDDPAQRTSFIHALQTWRDGLRGMPDLLPTIQNHPSLQYALVLGLANADESELMHQSDAWKAALMDQYISTSDTGLRAACEYAFGQLKVELPVQPDAPAGEQSHDFTNSLGMRLIRISPGSYERESQGNEPTCQITISRDFYLGDREVTISQFAAFLNESSPSDQAQLPATKVTWQQATDFCNWLSEQEGLTRCYQGEEASREWIASANGYRLPTQGEWEWACRAGAKTRYAIGEDQTFLSNYAIYQPLLKPCSVASRFPARNGLFDMSGNVSEWCFDQWETAKADHTHLTDPLGPTSSAANTYGTTRIIRGGSAGSTARPLSCSARNYANPEVRSSVQGFRVARSVE